MRHFFAYILVMLFFTEIAAAHGTKDKSLISPSELASEKEMYQIIDLRSSGDFRQAHIPSAFSLPLAELSENELKSRGIGPNDSVVLYGVSETSSRKGKMLLEILGYKNIRMLAGGITHWLEDGQHTATGPVQPERAVSKEALATELEIVPETHDFGVIDKANGIVSTTFVVRNPSAAEILITEITTSCGCTTAEIDAETIPPGGTRTLTVQFDPNFHKEPEGKFSRTVFLQTSNNKETQVRIEVEIAK